MTDNEPRQRTDDAASRCSRCRADLAEQDVYRLENEILCETCCLDRRVTRPRKTHWQYISSVKEDYLKPGKS